jgi:hypothetical protein
MFFVDWINLAQVGDNDMLTKRTHTWEPKRQDANSEYMSEAGTSLSLVLEN